MIEAVLWGAVAAAPLFLGAVLAAAKNGSAGGPLAVGALLDGIPEQLVLGIGLAAGEGVSVVPRRRTATSLCRRQREGGR